IELYYEKEKISNLEMEITSMRSNANNLRVKIQSLHNKLIEMKNKMIEDYNLWYSKRESLNSKQLDEETTVLIPKTGDTEIDNEIESFVKSRRKFSNYIKSLKTDE
ncbi:MAG: hypothetical protein MHPSP_004250, partial [Paramarteilia canceri]